MQGSLPGQAGLNGLQFPLRIVAVVKSFPTVTGSSGGLIIDLPAVQQRLVSQGAARAASSSQLS